MGARECGPPPTTEDKPRAIAEETKPPLKNDGI
jgi:hypothetical protein